MDNPEEMNKVLERCNQLRLSQEETETTNRPIICTEIEPVILKKLPHKRQDQMISQVSSIIHLQIS